MLNRRELLRTLGAAAALTIVPGRAAWAWQRVAAALPLAHGLTGPQLALIASIADAIFPRTATPSATDVRVPAFIDVIVSENYSDAERQAFVAGLDLIQTRVSAPADVGDVIDRIEAETDREAEPARTYWLLKGLVVHGYFTSEAVMKDVLRVPVMPGKFDGDAPMPTRIGAR